MNLNGNQGCEAISRTQLHYDTVDKSETVTYMNYRQHSYWFMSGSLPQKKKKV